ncbi:MULTISPECIES: hypothetical protein [unclassified Microbacterium]|uniref:hypothetical protein n=1 Tax=unclassified Microbacterium TaxID=2609290 RepID=UPI00214B9E5B|nr:MULTISPECIES: hypothetical protein [unclassified Microbacterium]MCR2784596.1 hypothetical protein [Microbacterium sp. zg.B96]MDL5350485.1 hypothetical protein [Microbacterium sp. zg-YB36]WIM14597.1 hypothetical protein QNO11_08410 [Microbacterium sp. zg-B96]
MVSQFVSRSNDIDGLWGVGILSKSLSDASKNDITYDLLNSADALAARAVIWLRRRIVDTQVPRQWIDGAYLRVSFTRGVEPPADDVTRIAWEAGVPVHRVVVTATITDDRGRDWESKATTWCWDVAAFPALRSARRERGTFARLTRLFQPARRGS